MRSHNVIRTTMQSAPRRYLPKAIDTIRSHANPPSAQGHPTTLFARYDAINPENTNALITLLAKLLSKDWKEEEKISAFLTSIDKNDVPDTGLDPLHLLATSLHKSNSTDPSNFVFSTQLDVMEPETYKQAMNGSHAQQWAHASKKS